MDNGHWRADFTFEPTGWFGFIYRIVELSTGREYVGKKQFNKLRRKAVKGRKNRKHVVSESDWRTYTGSSEHLNAAIEANGIDNYVFIIESLHKTRGSLHYAEVRLQVIEDVLRAVMQDGVTKKYYNRNIAAIKFLPPPESSDESLHKMRSPWNMMTPDQRRLWLQDHAVTRSIEPVAPADTSPTKAAARATKKPRVTKPSRAKVPIIKQEITCPHCRKTGSQGTMARYHFDRCKSIVLQAGGA